MLSESNLVIPSEQDKMDSQKKLDNEVATQPASSRGAEPTDSPGPNKATGGPTMDKETQWSEWDNSQLIDILETYINIFKASMLSSRLNKDDRTLLRVARVMMTYRIEEASDDERRGRVEHEDTVATMLQLEQAARAYNIGRVSSWFHDFRPLGEQPYDPQCDDCGDTTEETLRVFICRHCGHARCEECRAVQIQKRMDYDAMWADVERVEEVEQEVKIEEMDMDEEEI